MYYPNIKLIKWNKKFSTEEALRERDSVALEYTEIAKSERCLLEFFYLFNYYLINIWFCSGNRFEGIWL